MTSKTSVHTIYKLASGERVPSVTTYLAILAKPAIIHWAWEQGVVGNDYRKARDQAGEIGKLVHYLILCHLKGEEPDLMDYSPHDVIAAGMKVSVKSTKSRGFLILWAIPSLISSRLLIFPPINFFNNL